MAFINFSGVQLSGIAYVVSAIVLLPINSALNPILYSDVFDKLIDVVRNRILSKFQSNKCIDNGIELAQINDAKKQMVAKTKLVKDRMNCLQEFSPIH